MRSPNRLAAAIAVAGAAATAGTSAAFNMRAGDALELATIAGGAALGAGALGALLLWVLRRRSISAQIGVVAVVCVAAAGAGVMAAAGAMFIAPHDRDTLLVILLATGTVGALVASALGRRVVRGSQRLGDAVRRIGEGGAGASSVEEAPDTAELAALAGELDRMRGRLEEAAAREHAVEASRRELVAWVSHDLRTPLAGIRALTEALEDRVVSDPTEVARAYRTLRREADRLSELVDDLFELSVIQAGALRIELERASLGDLVSDALAAAEAPARARGVRVEGSVIDQPLELPLSPSQVSRVLRNLIENAIRHTPADGAIHVEAGLDGGSAYVTVADGCGGISPGHLERIFEPSFRGDAARTPREGGGAGLGLAIALGIVQAHRGEITVENNGPGCRFVVRLPLPRPA